MTDIQKEIKELLLSLGVSDVGFCNTEDGVGGLTNAVSIVFRPVQKLADTVSDKIEGVGDYFRSSASFSCLRMLRT